MCVHVHVCVSAYKKKFVLLYTYVRVTLGLGAAAEDHDGLGMQLRERKGTSNTPADISISDIDGDAWEQMHCVCVGCSRPDDIIISFSPCTPRAKKPTLRQVTANHVCMKCLTAHINGAATRQSVADLVADFRVGNKKWHVILSNRAVSHLQAKKINPFKPEDSQKALDALATRPKNLLVHAREVLNSFASKYKHHTNPYRPLTAPTLSKPICPPNSTNAECDMLNMQAKAEYEHKCMVASEPCKEFLPVHTYIHTYTILAQASTDRQTDRQTGAHTQTHNKS